MRTRLFILGAGFSRYQGLPLVSELRDPFRNRFEDEPDEGFRRLLSDCEDDFAKFNLDERLGFEQILSNMKQELGAESKCVEYLRREIVKLFYRRDPVCKPIAECYI